MSVTILDHALIQHKLTIMRDKNTSTYIFKQNLDEIAKLMAFEVTRNVSLKDKAIETPVCPMVGKEMDQQIILAPILRAGIGLVDGFRDIIPTAKVGHIGMERDEETYCCSRGSDVCSARARGRLGLLRQPAHRDLVH